MLRTTGRRMVFWGALLLLGWAAYELYVRIDEMLIWLTPVNSLVRQGRLTWMEYLREVPWQRLSTHLFLIVGAVFAVVVLLLRKRVFPYLLIIPFAILLVIFSLGSTPLMKINIWQNLKLLPLLLIIAGSALTLAGSLVKKKTEQKGGAVQQRQNYDPFRMKRQ